MPDSSEARQPDPRTALIRDALYETADRGDALAALAALDAEVRVLLRFVGRARLALLDGDETAAHEALDQAARSAKEEALMPDSSEARQRPYPPDYIERTIATIRNHRDAGNCWPQWANIFADQIEWLEGRVAALDAEVQALREAMRENVGDAYDLLTQGELATQRRRPASQRIYDRSKAALARSTAREEA